MMCEAIRRAKNHAQTNVVVDLYDTTRRTGRRLYDLSATQDAGLSSHECLSDSDLRSD
jgi:hypothetical protein